MTKKNFLTKLKKRIIGLPKDEINDILVEYDTHFISGKRDGKTEEDISKELGNPDKIGKELKAVFAINNCKKEMNCKNIFIAIFHVMSLGLLNFILLLASIFLLIILFPVIFTISISGILLLLSPVYVLIFGALYGFDSITISDIFNVFFAIIIGLIITIMIYYSSKYIHNIISKYLFWNIRIVKSNIFN